MIWLVITSNSVIRSSFVVGSFICFIILGEHTGTSVKCFVSGIPIDTKGGSIINISITIPVHKYSVIRCYKTVRSIYEIATIGPVRQAAIHL